MRVVSGSSNVLMLATEAVSTETLQLFAAQGASAPRLVMTGTRANVLGIDKSDRVTCVVSSPNGLDTVTIEYLANPLTAKAPQPKLSELIVNQATALEMSCVKIAKLSRLLPAAVLVDCEAIPDAFSVDADAIDLFIEHGGAALATPSTYVQSAETIRGYAGQNKLPTWFQHALYELFLSRTLA